MIGTASLELAYIAQQAGLGCGSYCTAGDRYEVMRFPASAAAISRFARTLPELRGSHSLPVSGRWVRRELAAAVNALLVDFRDDL